MNVLDLFSGIGGFTLGLERAGMRTVAFCELDSYCRAVLAKHWPGVPCYDDVRAVTAERLRANGIVVDVVTGGFPCQDISAAGGGAGLDGEHSGLWAELARIVGEVRPRYVLVENVATLLVRGLSTILGRLAALGYDAEWHCVPACAIGAPHERDRIWIIAYPMAIAGRARLALGPGTLAEWSHATTTGAGRWTREPGIFRVAYGVPARVHRLRGIGNAVVPQIVEMLGRAIMKHAAAESETFLSGAVQLFDGDCRDVLEQLPASSVDACVTDPPYHLTSIVKRFGKAGSAPAQFGTDGRFARASAGFMGKQWDGGDIAFDASTWRAVFRVLKPGAHLLAMGGTRTYHRMACAIEDAGFEIRDCVTWLYGSGFPKSHEVADGQGTALKPAQELVALARKPLAESTVAGNVRAYGTGGLNIDACRIPTTNKLGGGDENATSAGKFTNEGWRRPWMDNPEAHAARVRANVEKAQELGRWPANVIHDGSADVLAEFPESESGEPREPSGSRARQSDFHMTDGNGGYGDSGSAARFFYTAKADQDERAGSDHPTVKPLDLIRYLVRLITPAGGLVLDPFAGTGTTGEAAWCEGRRAVLIEREAEYLDDCRRRLVLALAGPEEKRRAIIAARGELADVDELPLFAAAFDPHDDIRKSTAEGFRAIRERVAAGGPGWHRRHWCEAWPDCGCGTQSGPHTCERNQQHPNDLRETGNHETR